MSVRENQLIDFISDSDKYERLLSFEDQMKYQTEIISSFFNQQNITDNTGKDNKLNIFETQSMTNLPTAMICTSYLYNCAVPGTGKAQHVVVLGRTTLTTALCFCVRIDIRNCGCLSC